MQVEDLGIVGVKVLRPKKHVDNRGFFSEVYNRKTLTENGVDIDFVQDNHSLSRQRGTIRGLHFQLPPKPQAKLVRVVRGRILDVAVDLRRGSPMYGSYVAAELSAENGDQLYVPVGFAHGFCTLDTDTEIVYKVSEFYAPECDAGVRWNDPQIGIVWPFEGGQATLSEKDAKLPFLRDLVSPFEYDGVPLAPL